MFQKIKDKLFIVPGFVIFLWCIELLNLTMDHRLCSWGVYPRKISGLTGIPLSPFIHNGIRHLLLNTVPLLVLGGFVIISGVKKFLEITLFIIFSSGLSVWFFGRPSFHVGVSGLIFGYFGFLLGLGWYGKNISSIFIAFITFFLYGSIIWGALPTLSHISWEGHLSGLAAGILGARLEQKKK